MCKSTIKINMIISPLKQQREEFGASTSCNDINAISSGEKSSKLSLQYRPIPLERYVNQHQHSLPRTILNMQTQIMLKWFWWVDHIVYASAVSFLKQASFLSSIITRDYHEDRGTSFKIILKLWISGPAYLCTSVLDPAYCYNHNESPPTPLLPQTDEEIWYIDEYSLEHLQGYGR